MSLISPYIMQNKEQSSSHLAPFIGRQADLERILNLFEDPTVRLVTLLGAGGIGKTRLAIELADRLQLRFKHGAVFIPLAQLNTTNDLLPALAEKLGVQLPPGGNLKQTVLSHLAGRQMLLIMDNFEHLLDEAVLVHDILVAGPQVKVLATSREKLGLKVESLYHLEGLELPPPDDLSYGNEFDAVQLFLQKARQARPGFSLDAGNAGTVIQICRLVDGNALGILLAAAWVEHFSPEEIIDHTAENLDFLEQNIRDGEARHSSMRAVFNPSLERLSDRQKTVFRRLAYFRGGFDLAAATSVAGADLHSLIALVEKSLLSRNPNSGRYELHELLRQYAGEELEATGESKKNPGRLYNLFPCFCPGAGAGVDQPFPDESTR
jgi:predicted ATPase